MEKRYLFPLLAVCSLSGLMCEAFARDQVWVAKLSHQQQCEEALDVSSLRLGEAIVELEQNGKFSVASAKLARLNDRYFCSACNCPAGIFYVAQVRTDSSSLKSLPSAWEVISPESVQELDPLENPLEFRIIPEDPTQ